MNTPPTGSIVHVLGPGALGSLWAARLSSHLPVCLVGRQEALSEVRFYLEDGKTTQSITLPYRAVSQFSQDDAVDTVLVFTKSYDTLPALKTLAPALVPSARIVLFQNGLGSQLSVVDTFPGHRIFAAVTTEGANRPAPATVVHAGRGTTWVGGLTAEMSQTMLADVRALEALLGNTGLQIEAVEDIRAKLWVKLAINCAINPFTVLLKCANGAILQSELFQSSWPALRAELTELLELGGFPIKPEDLEARVFDVIQRTALNRSSMRQDQLAGRRTEIDDINGFAWRTLAAKRRSHATNLFLWREVSRMVPSQEPRL